MVQQIRLKNFNEIGIYEKIACADDVVSSLFDLDNRLSDLQLDEKTVTLPEYIDLLSIIITNFGGNR